LASEERTKGQIPPTLRQRVVEARTWLESSKKRGMALGLQGTKTVLDRLQLELPQHIFHVAGSNGKGTACAVMAATLSLEGRANVLFTSPHVCRIEERVRRNGIPLSPKEFDEALLRVRRAASGDDDTIDIELTFFEITYLVAMVASVGSEVLILETGLGGRLDATRSGPATVSLVTSVSCEHRDILGSDLPTIAREKAAIARPGCPILIREPEDQDVRNAMLEEATNAGNSMLQENREPADVSFVQIDRDSGVLDEAVKLATSVFGKAGFSTDSISKARRFLRWPARMHSLSKSETASHPYLLDAAHNPSGLLRILPELEQFIRIHAPQNEEGPVWTLLFGTSPQHDLDEMLSPFHEMCHRIPPQKILLTRPLGGRYPGVELEVLLGRKWTDEHPLCYPSALQAIESLAVKPAKNVGLVVSLGSLYLQGNILNAFDWASDENLSLFAKH
tara:strand:+ start:20914 stop:22263 length:1350 start_codon:yes stop_codon:yes gene_type:complete